MIMTSPETTVTARAVLSFNTVYGHCQFSIPRARLDKTTDTAFAAMVEMVESGALKLASPVTSPRGAKVIKTARTVIYGV